MSEPYRFTDQDGSGFTVYPWPRTDRQGASISWNHDHDGACIPPEKLDEVAAALYEAAGRPAPIVLDRPEIIPTDRVPVGSMSVEADGELVASELNWYRIGDPLRLAAALVAVHDRIEGRRASELASFLNDVWDHDTLAVARELLVRFKVEERA